MKKKVFIIMTILLSSLFAQESDWQEDSWDTDSISEMEQGNDTFKKMEIKNRSKKEYADKVYKYIENEDYIVKNNNIEIATIQLNDNLRNSNIEVNVMTENLHVEGDQYRGDTIDIKRNNYKHFVQHDESRNLFNDESLEDLSTEDTTLSLVETKDPLYQKVDDEDVSELETIDLRNQNDIKEVNVYIKNTTIRVDNNYENK